MNRLITTLFLILALTFPVLACERDITIDNVQWTFHRMQNGNSYHESVIRSSYSEGDVFTVRLPCPGNYIDSVQTKWDDHRSTMYGELFLKPGQSSFGRRDISGKDKAKWTLEKPGRQISIQFGGPRESRCTIEFVRVFYGVNPPTAKQELTQKKIPLPKIKLIDKIKLKKGKTERKCHVEKWNGSHFTVVLKNGGKKVRKRFLPGEIHHITFQQRWGHATGKTGNNLPFMAKRFERNMIWFDKKTDGKVISKTDYPIKTFTVIHFDK